MIKGIIFDLGGVLIDNPALSMKSYILSQLEISDSKLQSLTAPLMVPFQKGIIDEKEFWRGVMKGISPRLNITSSVWTKAIKNAYSPKIEMFSLVTELKKHGLKTGILSNTENPVVDFLSGNDFSMFDILIYSCLEGMRKPEKEIYSLAIHRMGFKSDQIIFVDDSETNIRASKESGMHGVLFISPAQVRNEIEILTGLLLKNDKY